MGRRVIASGVFDIVHMGHIYFLKKAKEIAGCDGELIVVVARDSTVKAKTGRLPIIPEEERRAIVEELKSVDRAVLGYEPPSIRRIIEEYKPDVIVLGYDQDEIEKEVRKIVEDLGIGIEIVKLGRFTSSSILSSTDIRERLSSYRR
ncbi:MAG: adenylyltransferase/cytidyltransferase family protein [Candidatus Bathyarchaeia archaeon]|nr:FAD synthase [Candidatus Bathyarchaeota archaeon]